MSSSIDSSEDAFLLQIFISGFMHQMWVSAQWKVHTREKHLVSCGKSAYWTICGVSLHGVCAAIWEITNSAFFLLGQHGWYAVADSWDANCAQNNLTKHLKHLPFSLMYLKQNRRTVDKAHCKYVTEKRAGASTAGSQVKHWICLTNYLPLLLFCSNTSWSFSFTLTKLCRVAAVPLSLIYKVGSTAKHFA